MLLSIRNLLVNIESRDSHLLNFSLEVIQLIIRERELLMLCQLSLIRNLISRLLILNPHLKLKLLLLRNYLSYLLFQRKTLRTKRLLLVFVPTMNLLNVLSLPLRLILKLSLMVILVLFYIDNLMMVLKL